MVMTMGEHIYLVRDGYGEPETAHHTRDEAEARADTMSGSRQWSVQRVPLKGN